MNSPRNQSAADVARANGLAGGAGMSAETKSPRKRHPWRVFDIGQKLRAARKVARRRYEARKDGLHRDWKREYYRLKVRAGQPRNTRNTRKAEGRAPATTLL